MPEDPPVEPAAQTPPHVLEANPTDPGAVREVFRARNRLAVSVMERPQQFTVAYSLGDIHRLTFLTHEERAGLQNEWHAWHRKYVRLTALGVCLWLAGLAAAWALWFRTGQVSGAIHSSFGVAISDGWLTALAVTTTLALLIGLPAFLAAATASTQADSYLRGYADGLTRGVNRALHITPEVEQEMWEELRQAERLDAGWRHVSGGPGGSDSAKGSEGPVSEISEPLNPLNH